MIRKKVGPDQFHGFLSPVWQLTWLITWDSSVVLPLRTRACRWMRHCARSFPGKWSHFRKMLISRFAVSCSSSSSSFTFSGREHPRSLQTQLFHDVPWCVLLGSDSACFKQGSVIRTPSHSDWSRAKTCVNVQDYVIPAVGVATASLWRLFDLCCAVDLLLNLASSLLKFSASYLVGDFWLSGDKNKVVKLGPLSQPFLSPASPGDEGVVCLFLLWCFCWTLHYKMLHSKRHSTHYPQLPNHWEI